MGQEANCILERGSERLEGKAYLESEAILFRGPIRLSIPLKDLAGVQATDGVLRLETPTGLIRLHLAGAAEKWATKIQNPRGLLEKLGVKPGLKVVVQGIADESFLEQLHKHGVTFGTRPVKGMDLCFLGLEGKTGLAKLGRLPAQLNQTGAVWAVWPKGQPAFKEDDIRAAALAAGLVDVKVVKFSESHSALKLVIPRAKR